MLTSLSFHLLGLFLTLITYSPPSIQITAPVPTSKYTAGQFRLRQATARPAVQEDAVEKAVQLREQASELARQGKYDEAIAVAKRALDEMEAAVGTNDARYGALLNDIASLYLSKGDLARAEELLKRLVAVAEELSSSDPSLLATARNNLGVVYADEGKYALAESELNQARTIRERVLGREHPEVGVTLTYIGQVMFQKGEYTNAERMYERALSLVNNKADDYQLEIAILRNNLALVYMVTGRLERAAEEFKRTLEIHRRLGGGLNPEVATVLDNLGGVYKAKGDYAQAERSYKEALSILEKLWGNSHVAIARVLNNLAELYRATGEYSEAEKALIRALDIYKNVPGVSPEMVAIAKNNLALLYRAVGKLAEAKSLFTEVLAFYEKEFGPNHLKTAVPLNNLAAISRATGEYDKARELYARAVSIYEQSPDADPTSTATAQQNLATLDLLFEDYAAAARGLEKARETIVKALGTNHPMVAVVLNNLAALAEDQGDHAKAIRLYEQAMDIRMKVQKPGHPDIAETLNNLGLLSYKQEDCAKAETLLRRALKMFEDAGLGNHSDVISVLGNLAFVLWARGNTGEAVETMVRATNLSEQYLGRLVAVGSSGQKRLYAESLLTQTGGVITLHLSLAPNDPEAARLALTTILRRKGRVLDTMIDQVANLRRRLKPQDQALLEKLQSINGRLSTLMRSDAGRADAAQSREEVARLEAEAAQLEVQLSASSAELGAQLQPVTLARVQQALPPDAALVEFVWYRPVNIKAKKETDRYDVPRYAAYVLRREGGPGFVDLGQAPLIELVLFRWRAALRDPQRDDVKQLARMLDKTVMQPVRRLLAGEHRIFLSPDGPLNLIPFSALVDEQDRYLVERYDFTYLTSGRDLLRVPNQFNAKQSPLVIANPLFDDGAASRAAGTLGGPNKAERAAQAKFEPLKGTEEEGRQVGELLKVAPLMGARATEGTLKQASGPSILHLATHGYFLPYQENEATKVKGFDPFRSLSQFTAVEESKSPLLRSGLAFAGANRRESRDGEDGVLTALEAVGLDLWGTKLVVLSACETGLGDVQIGEGVYGLRRSFMLAGAESLVMSFWKVEDEVTRDLMVQYYKRLMAGEGRSEALRQVQLKILSDAARKHPYYWAAFIHQGDWRTLDGQTPVSR